MIVSVVFCFLILGFVQGSNVYRTTEPGTLAHGYYPERYSVGFASHGYYPGYTGYNSGYEGHRTGYSGTAGYAPSAYYPGQHSVSYPYDFHYPIYPRFGYSGSGYGTLAQSYPGQVSHGYYPSYESHSSRTGYSMETGCLGSCEQISGNGILSKPDGSNSIVLHFGQLN